MQQLAESAPSPNASTFAGLLAALAAPAAAKPATPWPANEWPDDSLADDVATLSYEHALKAHARYRRPDPPDWAFPGRAVMEPPAARPNQASAGTSAAGTSVFEPVASQAGEEQTEPTASVQPQFAPEKVNATADEPDRKSASITIRMSQAECEQLRRRAAQAGLTISSYLRSCTFEAESLRAQVKQALMQLRSGVPAADPATPAPPRISWFRRLVNK